MRVHLIYALLLLFFSFPAKAQDQSYPFESIECWSSRPSDGDNWTIPGRWILLPVGLSREPGRIVGLAEMRVWDETVVRSHAFEIITHEDGSMSGVLSLSPIRPDDPVPDWSRPAYFEIPAHENVFVIEIVEAGWFGTRDITTCRKVPA